jgi:type IV pilus biogenesis protein CpaD/CtpE
MRQAGRTRLALALGALLWAGGCGYARPYALEADYGRSVTNNMAQMVANPRAGQDPTPTVGLDPKAAANLQDKYDKSFKKEEAAAPTISITTSGGGSK